MRIAQRPAELGFNRYDVPRLKQALKSAADKHLFQRVQAVLWVAQGHTIREVAELTGVSVPTVYNWAKLYLRRHHVATLADAPRSGRPLVAPRITAPRIRPQWRRNPLRLGSRTTVWSVNLLAEHLSRPYHCPSTPYTRRRRLKARGLRCKRPRYCYEEKAPHRAQTKGG